MRYEDRALLSRSNYNNFVDNYSTPSSGFTRKALLSLGVVALVLSGLFLFALVTGSIAFSSIIPVIVFLLVAFSLGKGEKKDLY